VTPFAVADEASEIVEPICNANRNDTWTMGLIYCDNRANEDYTLISPMSSASSYLVDTHGREVHSWTSSSGLRPGLAAYMLDDGDLLRTANLGSDGGGTFSGGGIAGKVERISWNGNMEWEWYYSSNSVRTHHDIEPLPNGNFLAIAWEYKSESESLDAGRDPNNMRDNALWPDHIVEVEPVGTNQGNIVWRWNAWDHLIQDYDSNKENYGVVADHPELIDVNFVDASGAQAGRSDWMHCNGIDYNAVLDQIALSCKNMNEIYIIDHSTTTAEAASHSGGNSGKGGDILYRWGNPESYGAGTANDQQFFGQHDVQWIEQGRAGAGDLIVFNNGVNRPGTYSSVDVISPPFVNGEYLIQGGTAWGPTAPSWTWDIGSDMYATSISGAERLENGNTLVTFGPQGTFFEVNLEGEIVWKYISPIVDTGPLNQGDDLPAGQKAGTYKNNVFKVSRYSSNFSGLVDKDLTPGDYIEGWTDNCPKEDAILWDSDGDGCLDDSDSDGVTDNLDICPGFDDSIDVDADGIPDGCDPMVDTDSDGVPNDSDLCEGHDDSIDVDVDGIPDGCDNLIDSDDDGVADVQDICEGHDDSIDVDADGIPDGCDSLIDSDGDNVSNILDRCEGHDDSIDIDADGIPDGCDNLIDSDADGVSDTEDFCEGHDDAIDVDTDGIPDGCDNLIDSDNDGISDSEDVCNGFNDSVDLDLDQIPDGCDDDISLPDENDDNETIVTESNPPPPAENEVTDEQSESELATKSNMALWMVVISLLIIFISSAYLLLVRGKESNETNWDSLPSMSESVAPLPGILPIEPVSSGPALPPGGLPPGWTMEQWEHYGQQYLDQLQ
jgi:hypothetical protein